MISPAETAIFVTLRLRMVEAQLRARGIADERVLDAMSRVPRHEFTAGRYRDQAYEDYPLPIGEGQTISQPYMVASMLEALRLTPAERVLEVGSGSGYLTALLAELATQVVSLERHTVLADEARELLAKLGYKNVKLMAGDGSQGYAELAPYNAIIVSAAAPQVPGDLLTQLAEGGRLILPVGREASQQLQLIHIRNGRPHTTLREFCRFVPLVSGVEA